MKGVSFFLLTLYVLNESQDHQNNDIAPVNVISIIEESPPHDLQQITNSNKNNLCPSYTNDKIPSNNQCGDSNINSSVSLRKQETSKT